MDIRVLYTIVAIAEHGSFLAASRALNLSPAAVSLHVKIIEDELGETLFDRSVRPPTLTEAGHRTLERARRVLEAWEQLGEGASADVAGLLTVGAVPTTVAGLVAPALARLHPRRPQLRVTLTTADADELEERLSRGTVDVALTMQPASPPPGQRFTPVLDEPFEVVAPAGSEGDDDATLLRARPFIRFRQHAWIAHAIEQEVTRRRLRLDATMEVDTLDAVLALIAYDLGVSILPAGQRRTNPTLHLRTLPFGQPVVSRTIGLLHRPDHPKAPQIEELLAVLFDLAAGSAQRGEGEGVEGGDDRREGGEEAEVDAEDEPRGGDLE